MPLRSPVSYARLVMWRPGGLVAAALALVMAIPAAHLAAQRSTSLGTVVFPNSGDPGAQADFLRGVAWLHSFGYEEAIDAFRAAQRIDPTFTMAFWGEALSHNQPLWFHEDVGQGRAALAKLGPTPEIRAATAKSPREGAYLRAVEALYGPGDKATRDRAYSEAMAALSAAHPSDDEAHAFYALSLLAMLPRGDASLPLRQRAGAIAERVIARHPKHPGAHHYVLHAYDHAALAGKAIPAARAYAQIAPVSSHALHMPAHAFIQLGMWDEAAASDQASWDASVAWAARKRVSVALRDFHSLGWLHYELTQQGRFAKAAEAVQAVEAAMKVVKDTDTVGGHHYADSSIGRGSGPLALRNDRGSMRARAVIESERWDAMAGQGSFDNIDELFALGMSATKRGDAARARAALDLLRKAAAPDQDPGLQEQAAVQVHELEGLMAFAEGQRDAALGSTGRAAALQSRMPKPIGRPFPVKGADELHAELLLEAGRSQEAVNWFEQTLARTPNRSRALLGLARAAAKAGDAAKSRQAYQQFLKNWRDADPGLPELAEARAAVGSGTP